MELHHVIGPTVSDLRSFRAGAGGLPIWKNLENELVQNPDVARYVCAVLSTWLYSDAKTISTIMARLGLQRNRCLMFTISNNAALIRSTGCLVQSHDGSVALLAYRGTDPFDVATWAVNGDANPATVCWPPQAAAAALQVPMIAPSNGAGANVADQSSVGGLVASLLTVPRFLAQTTLAGVGTAANLAGAAVGLSVQGVAQVARGLGFEQPVAALDDAGRAATMLARAGAAVNQIALDAHAFIDSERPEEKTLIVPEVRVHAGFYRNQRATWFQFAAALKRALGGQSILGPGATVESLDLSGPNADKTDIEPDQPLEHFYITGHSQGAAMALLAAFRLGADDNYTELLNKLRHVYAFAPPQVGNGVFATTFTQKLGHRVSCFVYKKDVVPRLPPEIPGTLDFQHVGKFYEVPASDARPSSEVEWKEAKDKPKRAGTAGQLLLAFSSAFGEKLDLIDAVLSTTRNKWVEETARSFVRGLLEDRLYSLYDHFPERYMETSQVPGRRGRTELGDDY